MTAARESDRVVVVGGGLGGLATACTLAARGYAVTLCDKNPWVGGKAAVLAEQGFRFDMGPTILTIPRVLKRIYAEAGRDLEDHLDLVPLDPQWRSFFDDGSTLDLHADVDRMRSTLDAFAPGTGSGQGYARFMDLSERLHRISEDYFFWRNVGGLKDMFDARRGLSLSILKEVMGMRPGRSVAGTVRSFVPDQRAAQMLDHFTQYVGSSPDASPAVLCGIAHMQSNDGVWYPRGGTGAVPRALASLAVDLGVDIRTKTPIRRIIVDGGRVRGVETEAGETIAAGAVVSNSDSVRTHRELVEGRPRERFLQRRRYEPACSGVVLYLGLDKRYEQLIHHNFVFSHDPHEEFEMISRRGVRGPGGHRTRRRAPRGRGPLCARAHPLSAAAPRLVEDVRPVPPPDHRKAREHGGHEGPRATHRLRTGADTAGHQRPLPRARWCDLRPREPRKIPWRIQAGQSVARYRGALPGRRLGPPRPRYADGDDVGMDRRRLRRSGWGRCTCGIARRFGRVPRLTGWNDRLRTPL
jgi:phytoene dehydrogenase-like protein